MAGEHSYHEWRYRVANELVDPLLEAFAAIDFHDAVVASLDETWQQLSIFQASGTLPEAVDLVLQRFGLQAPEAEEEGDNRRFLAEAPCEPAPGWWVVTDPDLHPATARLRVVIPPTTAFGDGRHPSTRVAARLLQQLDCTGRRVLDLGCGTGLLGTLAGLAGASAVAFADIDAAAVAVAANVARGAGLSDFTVWRSDLLQALPDDLEVDLLIGNLYADLALDLLADPRLDRILPQGQLLLSGIADQRVEYLIDRLTLGGWTIGQRDAEAWWHGLVVQR